MAQHGHADLVENHWPGTSFLKHIMGSFEIFKERAQGDQYLWDYIFSLYFTLNCNWFRELFFFFLESNCLILHDLGMDAPLPPHA